MSTQKLIDKFANNQSQSDEEEKSILYGDLLLY